MFELARPAARKQSHEWASIVKMMRTKEFCACSPCLDFANERMPDELHRYTGITIKFFLKRKNTEGLCKAAAHQSSAPGTPGPKLRAYKINVADPSPTQLTRE